LLDGFGYVPSGFEHVHQVEHARGSGKADVEPTALPLVGLRVVLAHGDFQRTVDLADVLEHAAVHRELEQQC
jgi:hypothetical protein